MRVYESFRHSGISKDRRTRREVTAVCPYVMSVVSGFQMSAQIAPGLIPWITDSIRARNPESLRYSSNPESASPLLHVSNPFIRYLEAI